MTLNYFRETHDDGKISIYNISTPFNYHYIMSNIENHLHDCNGYSINNRQSAIFSTNQNKIGKPLSDDWLLVPPRYRYQKFIPILHELHNEILKLNIIPDAALLTDAFVNLYGDGDFIAFHKDHHDEDNNTPIACILSFEKFPEEHHILQFYRTLGDKYAPTKKDRGLNKESFDIKLPNSSLTIMEGMQKKYVHGVKPGKPRISIVFTTR